jgi:hypothetical protein
MEGHVAECHCFERRLLLSGVEWQRGQEDCLGLYFFGKFFWVLQIVNCVVGDALVKTY